MHECQKNAVLILYNVFAWKKNEVVGKIEIHMVKNFAGIKNSNLSLL